MAKLYYLEEDERDGQGWFRCGFKPDYLSEWRDYVLHHHYAALADICEFGIDTHSNFRAVSVDGSDVVILWQ